MPDVNIVRPFAGLIAAPDAAQKLIAPPYDVVTCLQAHQRVQGGEQHFLHVTRPDLVLATEPEGVDGPMYQQDALHQQGAKQFEQLVQAGLMQQDESEHFYVYQLQTDTRVQTGLVAAISVAAYHEQRVRQHEHTRPDKAADRLQHLTTLKAQISPVLLCYREQPVIAQCLAASTTAAPYLQAELDNVVHRLWRVSDRELQHRLSAAFAQCATIYIADGHHRTAASAKAHASGSCEPWASHCLGVLFSDQQLQILGYHRALRSLKGMPVAVLLERLQDVFDIEKVSAWHLPTQQGEMFLSVSAGYYRLQHRRAAPAASIAQGLDVAQLFQQVLAPMFNIQDERKDDNVVFVGGHDAEHRLSAAVQQGELAAAFLLHPVSVGDWLAVSDSGQMLPPKSTWFEPKLADGLIAYR